MARDSDRQAHWNRVYSSRDDTAVSWYQRDPAISAALVSACNPSKSTSLIDIGCGASRLVDELLRLGLRKIDLLDVSAAALNIVRQRLDVGDAQVTFHNSDITQWLPNSSYDIWHDRAVMHFLVSAADREAYRERIELALKPGGFIIIGSFALDGPEKCSGLPVKRYSAESLQEFLGNGFELLDDLREEHQTPVGKTQPFQFCRFVRK